MERKWWTLIVVCVGTFMLLLDITIVNVALPKIATDLKASFSDIQWVIDAYALTLASLLLTAGTLADLLGRRLLFAIGLGLFAFTSLLCALSPSALVPDPRPRGPGDRRRDHVRDLAGAARAGVPRPRARHRVRRLGRDDRRLLPAIGPLLGGVLTEAFGWSSIFYINVPIGIAAAAADDRPRSTSRAIRTGRRIDWIGTVTFTGALFLLVFAIIRGNAEGWGSTLIVGAASTGAVVLLVAFLISQFVQDNAMFDLSLFRKPTFGGASIVGVHRLVGSMFAMFLYLDAVPPDDPRLLAAADRPAIPAVHRGLVLRRRRCRATCRRESPSGSCSASACCSSAPGCC